MLETRSVKPTVMRLLVLDLLLKQKTVISHTDLEEHFDKVDKSTLYRTLKTFQQHKVIHRIDDGTGAVKYAVGNDDCQCGSEDLHLHFHCLQRQRTFCLTDYHVPVVPPLPRNYVLNEVSLVLKGLCDECSFRYRTL